MGRLPVAPLDLRDHFVDVGGRELMLDSAAHRLTFRSRGSPGLLSSGLTQRLANPFREGHAVSPCNFLEFSKFLLVEKYL